MTEVDPITFRLDPLDSHPDCQRSLYGLTAITHELIVAHDAPDELILAYDAQDALESPVGFASVFTAIRCRDGTYTIDACLPSVRAPHLVNAVEYRARLPREDERVATIAIDGLSRIVYPSSSEPRRPRPASVINSLTATLGLFVRRPTTLEAWSVANDTKVIQL